MKKKIIKAKNITQLNKGKCVKQKLKKNNKQQQQYTEFTHDVTQYIVCNTEN